MRLHCCGPLDIVSSTAAPVTCRAQRAQPHSACGNVVQQGSLRTSALLGCIVCVSYRHGHYHATIERVASLYVHWTDTVGHIYSVDVSSYCQSDKHLFPPRLPLFFPYGVVAAMIPLAVTACWHRGGVLLSSRIHFRVCTSCAGLRVSAHAGRDLPLSPKRGGTPYDYLALELGKDGMGVVCSLIR